MTLRPVDIEVGINFVKKCLGWQNPSYYVGDVRPSIVIDGDKYLNIYDLPAFLKMMCDWCEINDVRLTLTCHGHRKWSAIGQGLSFHKHDHPTIALMIACLEVQEKIIELRKKDV